MYGLAGAFMWNTTLRANYGVLLRGTSITQLLLKTLSPLTDGSKRVTLRLEIQKGITISLIEGKSLSSTRFVFFLVLIARSSGVYSFFFLVVGFSRYVICDGQNRRGRFIESRGVFVFV